MVLILTAFVLTGCTSVTVEATEEHTVIVKTSGGMPLDGVEVRVYSDETKNDLLWAGMTDEEGRTPLFTVTAAPTCVAVAETLPEGYIVPEFTEMKPGDTVITAETKLLPEVDLSEVTYKLGSIAHDFTVTAADGSEYTLSSLLEEKRAVVLNFWFMNCGPCRMEFPYLQQAYLDYKDKLEVLALNPLDGNDESIAAFAEELGLTFPMSKTDPAWERSMVLTAYPTTVVIDRYGMITMIHKGSITEKETFTKIFDYFTSDEYTQSIVRNASEITDQN